MVLKQPSYHPFFNKAYERSMHIHGHPTIPWSKSFLRRVDP